MSRIWSFASSRNFPNLPDAAELFRLCHPKGFQIVYNLSIDIYLLTRRDAGQRAATDGTWMIETISVEHAADGGAEGRSLLAGVVYSQLRGDILAGRLAADERLKIADLAERYSVSANPVREALQQLRGEGFVVTEPNRGARVRRIDEDFFRDINEVEMLIEPHLTRYFVGIATDADIAELEAIQAEIEALNFSDMAAHGELDTRFHRLMYDHNYNRHMGGHVVEPSPDPGGRHAQHGHLEQSACRGNPRAPRDNRGRQGPEPAQGLGPRGATRPRLIQALGRPDAHHAASLAAAPMVHSARGGR